MCACTAISFLTLGGGALYVFGRQTTGTGATMTREDVRRIHEVTFGVSAAGGQRRAVLVSNDVARDLREAGITPADEGQYLSTSDVDERLLRSGYDLERRLKIKGELFFARQLRI
jgi:hypothetical protein